MITDVVKRDLESIIHDNLENLQAAQESHGGVYLARIDMIDTDGVISLEVELDEGTIAFTYPVDSSLADECYEYLKYHMEDNGIHVFTVYSEFEAALNGED